MAPSLSRRSLSSLALLAAMSVLVGPAWAAPEKRPGKATAADEAPTADPWPRLKRIHAALDRGDGAAALQLLQPTVTQEARAAFLRGRAQFLLQDYDAAAQAFAATLKKRDFPLADYAAYYLGESLFRSGRFAEAHGAFQRALKEKTTRWAEAATYRMADALYGAGDYAGAQKEYTRLLKDYPEHPRRDIVRLAVAECELKRGKAAAGARLMQELWLDEPASGGGRLAGRRLASLKKSGVALPAPDRDALLSRIRSLRLARYYQDALDEATALRRQLEEKNDRGSDWRRATLEMGLSLLGAAEHGKAEALFLELHKTAPNPRAQDSLNYWLARARELGGNTEGAVKAYLARAAFRPKTAAAAEYLWDAVTTAFDGGRYDLAEQLMDRLVKEHKVRRKEMTWFRTWIAYRRGRYDEAQRGLEKLRKRSPDMASYWLARVAEARGDKKRALALWNEVLRNDPSGYYGYLARSRLLERGADPKQLQMVSAPPAPAAAAATPTDVPGDLKLVDDGAETVTPEAGLVSPIFRDTPSVTLSPIPASPERAESLPDLSELVREFPELLPPIAKSEVRRDAPVSAQPAEPSERAADGDARDDDAPGEAPAGPDVTAEAVAQNPVAAYARVAGRFGKKALPLTRAAELRALGLKEDAARELRATIAATGGWGVSARTLGLSWKGRKEARRAQRIAKLPMQAYREIGQLAREAGDAHLAMKLLPGPDGDRRWYPQAYRALVTRVAGEYDVPPSLLWALMRTESAFQNYVTSRAGARGLMQIMPKTGRNIARTLGYEIWSPDALYDPEISLRFAGWYVRQLIDKFKGQLPLAIGSYNGGPHNVARWLLAKGQKTALDEFVEEIPFRETRGYVKKVLRVMAQYQRLYENRNDLVVTQKLNVDVGSNINY